LDSKTNLRTDQYGGSLEKKYRFLKEVMSAVLEVWPSRKVGVRLSPNGVFNDMGSPDFR
jgi:N-ethylmaleimide reductase